MRLVAQGTIPPPPAPTPPSPTTTPSPNSSLSVEQVYAAVRISYLVCEIPLYSHPQARVPGLRMADKAAAGKQFLKLFVKPAAVVSGKKFLELSVKPAAACSEHASIKLLQEELANQKTKLAAKKAWALTELVTSLVTGRTNSAGTGSESFLLPCPEPVHPTLPRDIRASATGTDVEAEEMRAVKAVALRQKDYQDKLLAAIAKLNLSQ